MLSAAVLAAALWAHAGEPRPDGAHPPARGSSSVRNLGGVIYHRSIERAPDGGRRRTLAVAWPLLWAREKSEPSGRGPGDESWDQHVKILDLLVTSLFDVRADNYRDGVLRVHYIRPFGYFRRGRVSEGGSGEVEREFRFWPLVDYRRTWQPLLPGRKATLPGEGPGAEGGVRVGERVSVRLLEVAFSYERDAAADRTCLSVFALPGGGVPARTTGFMARPSGDAGPGTDESGTRDSEYGRRKSGRGDRSDSTFRAPSSAFAVAGLPFGLLAVEKGPSTDLQVSALLRMIHVSRAGAGELASRTSVNEGPRERWGLVQWLYRGSPSRRVRVGPLVSWESDWRRERRGFSLFWGLLERTREGDTTRTRLLWFLNWGRAAPSRATNARLRMNGEG